ncbi:MAG: MurR/RpiR family transcriptional regulator, partial [Actinobacteria bacterium]|nr:MurR/RpiR family transcriptional regulator [Actinomycetota bacterium]
MSPHGDLLVEVRAAVPSLRPSQRRVAEAILERPAWVAESSLEEVADACDTSTTTVSRLARQLGFATYREFRAALWRAAGVGGEDPSAPGPVGDIDPADSLAEIVAKVGNTEAQAVSATAAGLDLGQLERAVAALAGARRIDAVGIGASGLVAADLEQKLRRIGLAASAWTEAHAAATSAALLEGSDALVAISHTGGTAEVLTAAEIARAGGATVVAVTNFADSPLARAADVLLLTAARETTFRSGATTSRIAQLVVVDSLFVGVAARSFDASIDSLQRTRRGIEA